MSTFTVVLVLIFVVKKLVLSNLLKAKLVSLVSSLLSLLMLVSMDALLLLLTSKPSQFALLSCVVVPHGSRASVARITQALSYSVLVDT